MTKNKLKTRELLKKYVAEYPDQSETDGKVLRCKICDEQWISPKIIMSE